MAWVGPGLPSARLISTISAIGVAGVLGLAAQRISGRSLAGFLAAGFFLASPYVFHTTPLARVNSTALLFALVGLSLFERPTRARVLAGSAVLLGAVFTKQTAIDAVVAALLYCAVVARPMAALSAAVIAGAGFTVLTVL